MAKSCCDPSPAGVDRLDVHDSLVLCRVRARAAANHQRHSGRARVQCGAHGRRGAAEAARLQQDRGEGAAGRMCAACRQPHSRSHRIDGAVAPCFVQIRKIIDRWADGGDCEGRTKLCFQTDHEYTPTTLKRLKRGATGLKLKDQDFYEVSGAEHRGCSVPGLFCQHCRSDRLLSRRCTCLCPRRRRCSARQATWRCELPTSADTSTAKPNTTNVTTDGAM